MIDVPILVKDALRDGTLKKNYRFNVLNDDGTVDFTIDNETLVKESVSIDERMASGDSIKFGLCEGSSLEFQYFNHPNITNRRIQAFIDAEYEKDGEELTSNSYYRISKKGDYEVVVPSVTQEFELMYNHYQGSTDIITVPTSLDEQTFVFDNCNVGDTITFTSNDIKVIVKGGYATDWYEIPMGFFDVKESSRQVSTGIIKVVAYNKLMSDYLDAKANDLIGTAYNNILKYKYVSDVTIDLILNNALEGYSIENTEHFGFNVYQPTIYPMNFIVNESDWGVPEFCIYYSVYIQISDTSVLENVDGDRIIPGYTKLKIKGIDTLKNALIDYLGQGIYERYKNIFCCKMKNQIGTDYTIEGLGDFGDEIETEFLENLTSYDYERTYASGVEHTYYQMSFHIPVSHVYGSEPNQPHPSNDDMNAAAQRGKSLIDNLIDTGILKFEFARLKTGGLGGIEVSSSVTSWADITLRDLQSAVFESQCQFGQLDRTTDLFSGHELNGARLLPQETLYPEDTLYPYGGNLSAFKSMYSKLWADEGNIQSWRYLIITYKGLDEGGNEKEYKLQRTVNEHGTQNYNCSDNWLFKNLVWTSEQIGQYADAMVEKMRDMRWFPFEMWCAGLPYVETGDEIEIAVGENTYTTYVLQRQLKGIQNLQDTYINGTLDIF